MSEPMEGPSTPSSDVRGPQDLVARMNVATSEKWEQVPLPARQQLGYHERLTDARSGNGVNEYFNKSPEDLVHAIEQSDRTADTEQLSLFVGYHLEATEPPAEPAGAPGTAGYNQLNRNVPAAEGYGLDVEHTLTDAGAVRVLQFAPDQGLSEEEQAKVDGAGPYVPAKTLEVADEAEPASANGVLHGHPETFGKARGGSKKSAKAADGPPPVSTDDVTFAEQTSTAGAADEDGADEVPDGAVHEVLDWVGSDKARARQALEFEQSKPEPRSSLIAKLNDRI